VSDVHRRAAASAPRLSPEEVATRGFAASFRGISELEVRNYLRRVADEMAIAQAREDELLGQIEELREQVSNPPVVTEDRLLDALGEETARVLRSAQESAEQIRSRAEEKAATTIAEAEAAATAVREEADADARAMRDTAQTAAAARVAGMKCVLVLNSTTAEPPVQGNLLLDRLLGASAEILAQSGTGG